MIEKISLALHALIERLCLSLIAGLLCSQLVIVVLRYVYGIGFLKLQDFSMYCFSALVTLSVVYTFVRNAHVRVDVLRERQSERLTRYIDCAAVLLLLLPVFALTLYWAWPDIAYAWEILESSKETGGLPGRFLVKTTLAILCGAMLLQGLFILLRGGRFVEETHSER